eukprot:gene5031-3592_t
MKKGSSRSNNSSDEEDLDAIPAPAPQRYRIVPFELSDADPSSKSSLSKYSYQSINDEDHSQHHQHQAYNDGQDPNEGDDYILGPDYESERRPPAGDETMGTFVLPGGDNVNGKRKMVYPPAIPKKSDHDLHPIRICMYFTAFLLLVGLFYSAATLTRSFTCLGPPYLYITHKGSKNILKFSRDGCLIHEKVLWGVAHEDADLRGMVLGKYQGGDALYVADSAAGESGILLYGQCFESTSLRPFLDRVVVYKENRGANHAYGIAIDELTGNVYGSFQDTDVILRFAPEVFTPIPQEPDLLPLFLKKENKSDSSKSKPAGSALRRRYLLASSTGTANTTKKYSDVELAALHVGSPDEEREEEEEEKEIAKELPHIRSTKERNSKAQVHGPHHSQHGRPAAALGPHHMHHHAISKGPVSPTSSTPTGGKKSVIEDRRRYLQADGETMGDADEMPDADEAEDASSTGEFFRKDLPVVDGSSSSSNSTSGVPSDHNSTSVHHNNTTDSSPPKDKPRKHKTTADYDFYPGTFVQFGKPGMHEEKERGVRSIVWTKNSTELWIANEDLDSIVIVNRTGKLVGKVSVGKPIGLHYSNESRADWVFVGSKGSKTGQVYAVDIFTRTIAATFKYIGMKHPAGISSYQDVLFVGDQTRNNVVTFNITTGRVIKLIIPAKRIDGEIEQLLVSDC